MGTGLIALRPRLVLLIVGVLVVAALLMAQGTAHAACASSTPAAASFSDPTVGAPPVPDAEAGAPEILTVDATLDAQCRLTIDPKLQAPLAPNQYVSIFLGFDPPAPVPADETIDREVQTLAGSAPVLYDVLTGAQLAQLTAVGDAGFTATLDQLGLPASASLGIYVLAETTDPFPPFDEAPAVNSFMYRFQVSFTTPPPPPPAAAPPAPPVAPAAPAKIAPKQVGCKVPKLKGLTVKKAKAALKKAGCKYKLKGKGRVRSVSPKAGTTTAKTVQVKCKRKKRKKKARRSVVAIARAG